MSNHYPSLQSPRSPRRRQPLDLPEKDRHLINPPKDPQPPPARGEVWERIQGGTEIHLPRGIVAVVDPVAVFPAQPGQPQGRPPGNPRHPQ